MPDAEYILEQDVFVLVLNGWPGMLCRPNENPGVSTATLQATKLPSIEEFKVRGKSAPFVVGVLEKGSRIKVAKFQYFASSTFNELQIYAEIIDGEFKGKQVRIDTISRSSGGSLVLQPDQNWTRRTN